MPFEPLAAIGHRADACVALEWRQLSVYVAPGEASRVEQLQASSTSCGASGFVFVCRSELGVLSFLEFHRQARPSRAAFS